EVVAGERALAAGVELAPGIERERMRRDHHALAQRGKHLRVPILPAQRHVVTSSNQAVTLCPKQYRRQRNRSLVLTEVIPAKSGDPSSRDHDPGPMDPPFAGTTAGCNHARIAWRMTSTLCCLRLRHAAALPRSRPKIVDSVQLLDR